MAHAHVALSATFFGGRDLKRFGRRRETAPRQVFAEGSLNHRGQYRRHFLPLAVLLERSFEVVIQGDGCPLHATNLAPSGEANYGIFAESSNVRSISTVFPFSSFTGAGSPGVVLYKPSEDPDGGGPDCPS